MRIRARRVTVAWNGNAVSGWLVDPSRALDLEEARRLNTHARMLAAAGRKESLFRQARDGHLILFLLGTGCRITEALMATLADVSAHREGVYIHLHNLKHRKPDASAVMLAGRAADELRTWRDWLKERGADNDCPLFPGVPVTLGTAAPPPVTRQAAWRMMKATLRGLGIERAGVALHATRHAVAVATLKASGGNVRAAQGRLRHSSSMTTEAYARLLPDDFKAAVVAAQALLEGDP